MANHVEHEDMIFSEIWEVSDIDRFIDNNTLPDLWKSTNAACTYRVLQNVVERIKERGMPFNQSILNQIAVGRNPNITITAIPQYYNLLRKFSSKHLNLDTPVAWLTDLEEIGPICQSLKITPDYLNGLDDGISNIRRQQITNALILELRFYWWRKQYNWKVFLGWLQRLGVTQQMTPEHLRQKVNDLQKQRLKYIQQHKHAVLSDLLSKEFLPPTDLSIATSSIPSASIPDQHQIPTPSESSTTEGKEITQKLNELNTQLNHLLQEIDHKTQNQQSLKIKFATLKIQCEQYKLKLRQIQNNSRRLRKRKDEKLSEQKQQIQQLKSNLAASQQQIDVERGKHHIAQYRSTYTGKRNKQLKLLLEDEKAKVQLATEQLHIKDKQIDDLTTQVEDLLQDRLKIKTISEGKFTAEIRQTVMALGSLGLGTRNISKVIEIVSSGVFGAEISPLPAETTIKNFLLGANIIGKIQVCDEFLISQNSTLHVDGTTDHQRHFLGYQLSTQQHTYAVAMVETVSGDTSTQIDEFVEVVQHIAKLYSVNPQDEEELKTKMILSVKNLMTDQHIVNRKFKDEMEHLRQQLLSKTVDNWGDLQQSERENMVSIHQWFCLLHVLLGLSEATEDAVKEYESILTSDGKYRLGRLQFLTGSPQTDKSSWYEAVKAASALLTPSGHPAAGLAADFRAWMSSQQHTIHFVHFQHNRFNVTFHNSSALYHHRHHIQDFLKQNTHANQLTEAVKNDINDEYLMAILHAVAVFHILVTAPFHTLILRHQTSHILDVNPYFLRLQQALEEMSATPWCVTREGYAVWHDIISSPNIKPLCPSVLELKEDMYVDITMEALSLIASHALITFTRQVASHLPNGEHSAPSDRLRQESVSVPTSNSIGESQFAYLKHLRAMKPNANMESLEGSILWAYNKTSDWLRNLPPKKRLSIIEGARARRPDFMEKWKQRREQVKKDRLLKLHNKEKCKEDRATKIAVQKQKNIDDVEELGGQCKTEEDVNQLLQRYEGKPKELITALKSQIRYYKTVVNPPGIKKTHLQFSHQGKQFPPSQLAVNLKAIISKYQEYLSAVPSTSGNATVAPSDVRQAKIVEKKQAVLCNYSNSTRCRKGIKRKIEFPSSPSGKRIRHRWKIPGRKSGKWFLGTVVGLSDPTDTPTDLSDTENNLATNNIYSLFKVKYDDDENMYHLRLEKDWFRNDLEFLDPQ